MMDIFFAFFQNEYVWVWAAFTLDFCCKMCLQHLKQHTQTDRQCMLLAQILASRNVSAIKVHHNQNVKRMSELIEFVLCLNLYKVWIKILIYVRVRECICMPSSGSGERWRKKFDRKTNKTESCSTSFYCTISNGNCHIRIVADSQTILRKRVIAFLSLANRAQFLRDITFG